MRKINILILLFVTFSYLNVSAQYSGVGPLTMSTPVGATGIQWYDYSSGSPVIIPGETGTTYTTNTPGVYYYDATLPAGSSCDGAQTVYVIMSSGNTATLNGSVNNSGATSYQWFDQGAAMAGEVSADLTVSTGGLYHLEITTSCTESTSDYYVYTVLPPTTAITNICPDEFVNMDALFTGTPPAGTTLIWSTDNDSSDGLDMTGNTEDGDGDGQVDDATTVEVGGTYYAYFYDAVNDCYSPVSHGLVFTVTSCCDALAPTLSH